VARALQEGSSSERRALIAALAVHVSLLAVLPELAPPRRLLAARSGLDEPVEIDLVPVGDARGDGPALEHGSAADLPQRAARRERRPSAGEGSIEEGPASEPESGPREPGQGSLGPDDYGPLAPDPRLVGPPGLGGPPVWSVPGAIEGTRPAPAPTTAGSARPVDPRIATRVLEGTLGTTDRAKGLEVPVGGIVARAFEDSARGTTLPHDCRASFEVHVGPAGEVIAVRHLSATAGDATTWQRVGSRAAAALKARPLPTGGRARRGAIVQVTVVSRFVYPSGSAEPTAADALSNKSDVIHATVAVRIPGERPMPGSAVKPVDTSSPYTKALPRGVAPVEHKPVDGR
jgi:hypothetical protein